MAAPVGLFFFGSVQLAALGVIGEYVGSVHTMVQNRPLQAQKNKGKDLQGRGNSEARRSRGIMASIPAHIPKLIAIQTTTSMVAS